MNNEPEEAIIETIMLLMAELRTQLKLLRVQRASNRMKAKSVKPHLRCPKCWSTEGGKARHRKWQRKTEQGQRRCYVGTCGHEWVVDHEKKTAPVVVQEETSTVTPVEPGVIDPR